MSVLNTAIQILFYSFLGLMCLGGFCEFREYQDRLKNPPRNIGRRAASLAKRQRQYHRHIARTVPAKVAPIVAKPRSRREPVVVDPIRADIVSTLRNLGWNASQSNAAYLKSTGTGFDERLKNCLAVMASQQPPLREVE